MAYLPVLSWPRSLVPATSLTRGGVNPSAALALAGGAEIGRAAVGESA